VRVPPELAFENGIARPDLVSVTAVGNDPRQPEWTVEALTQQPGASRSAYIYDDAGNYGGLKPGSLFVIAGDQNSDPFDGDSVPGAAQQLLENPKVNAKVTPASPGGVDRSANQPGNES